MPIKLSDIHSAYKEGRTWEEMLSTFKISRYMLQKIIRESGIKRPRPNAKYDAVVDDVNRPKDAFVPTKEEHERYRNMVNLVIESGRDPLPEEEWITNQRNRLKKSLTTPQKH